MVAHDGYDPECIQYCCSDFRLQTDDKDALHYVKPDLNNEILAIFGKSKFVELTDAEYALLEMPLRLASRMLADDRAVKYIVTTTDGTLHLPNLRDGPKGQMVTWAQVDARETMVDGLATTTLHRYPNEEWDQVDEDMRQRSADIMNRLAGLVQSIILVEEIPNALAETIFLREFTPAAPTRAYFPRATHPVAIGICSHQVYGYLLDNTRSISRLRQQFVLAVILVHEVAHALNMAVDGNLRFEEVFYQDSCMNEAGYDLTSALFGGIPQIYQLGAYLDHEIDEEALVFEEYPNGQIARVMTARKNISQRWDLSQWVTCTRFPHLCIALMFTNKFWNQDVKNMVGPIQPIPPPQWMTRISNEGETVRNLNGDEVVSDQGTITMNEHYTAEEPGLHDVFSKIISEQLKRRGYEISTGVVLPLGKA